MEKEFSSQDSDFDGRRLVIDLNSATLSPESLKIATSEGSVLIARCSSVQRKQSSENHFEDISARPSVLTSQARSEKRRRVRLIADEDTSDEEANAASSDCVVSFSNGFSNENISPFVENEHTDQTETDCPRDVKSVRNVSRPSSNGFTRRSLDGPAAIEDDNASRSSSNSFRSRTRLRRAANRKTCSNSRELRQSSSACPIENSETVLSNNDEVPDSDDYCWICHKVGQMVVCSCCPRVYHSACLHTDHFPETWLCPECQDLVMAECAIYQASNWKQISKSQLQRMLYFLIDRLATQSWAEHFREPVDTEKVVGYSDVILYPMSLRTLYLRIKDGHYSSPQAFLGDFRWILHNCIVFNGSSAPVTSHARLLDRTCIRELTLMKACPICYQNRMAALHLLPSTLNKLSPITQKEWFIPAETATMDGLPCSTSTNPPAKNEDLDPWWFCKLCDDLHPLVWVRLQRYPCWPAKVMSVDGDSILVTFFGDYDLTMAPTGSVKLHSESRAARSSASLMDSSDISVRVNDMMPPNASGQPPFCSSKHGSLGIRSSKGSTLDPDVESNYNRAIAELDHHVSLIKTRYPNFKLPEAPMDYRKRCVNRYYKRLREVINSKADCAASTVQAEVSSTNTQASAQQLEHQQSASVTLAEASSCAYAEPLLSRVTDSFKKLPKGPLDVSVTRHPNAMVSTSVRFRTLTTLSADLPSLAVSNSRRSEVMDCNPSVQPVEDCLRSPVELHPVPNVFSPGEINDTDELRSLLSKFRSQFNELLADLEDKWRTTRSIFGVSREPPVLSAVTVEKETQTLPVNITEATKFQKTEDFQTSNFTSRRPASPVKSSPSTTFQMAMMEAEIERLDQEVKRLNLLLAFTRAEMALEARNRTLELRRVWNFEVSAILEAASKIWEHDVIRIIDSVKRKQWCAYCGRLAYYYCCWNTCYCNSVCQSKHWSSHINQCVQARSQNSTPSVNELSESYSRPLKPLPTVSNPSSLLATQSSQPPRWSNISGT